MSRRSYYLLILAVAGSVWLQEFAFALHHTVWSNSWWREPFLWSDRWHVLSFLAHWPLAVWVTAWLGIVIHDELWNERFYRSFRTQRTERLLMVAAALPASSGHVLGGVERGRTRASRRARTVCRQGG